MKRILALFLIVLMCASAVPLTVSADEIEYPTEQDLSYILSDMGMVTTWMGGNYFGESSVPSDTTVWYYMTFSGLLKDYYVEYDGTFEGYRIPYDEYIALVDTAFVNHSDMKDYLIKESTSEYPSLTYDESTGMISWFPGGMGDAVEWALLDYDFEGERIYAYGYFIEMLYDGNVEGMRENYDYVVKQDEYGESYWKISYAMRLILDYVDGCWKIASYQEINWYVLDGVLYNRAYNVDGSGDYMVCKNHRFNVNIMSYGVSGYDTDLWAAEFGHNKDTWYNVDYLEGSYYIEPSFDEGYEAECVVLYTENGRRNLTPNEEGKYEFMPAGDTTIMIYAKQIGSGSAVNTTDTTANFGQGDLVEGAPGIMEDILTAEEADAVNNGADATVYLNVSDITSDVDETTAAAIAAAAGDATVALYLDIELVKRVGDAEPVNVTETADKVMLSLNIPDELKAPDDSEVVYKVYRMHNGEAELIESEYDALSGGVLYIYTDKFSTYAIAIAKPCDVHTWGEWKIVQEPGEDYDGIRYHKCSECGASEYVWYTEDDVKVENPFDDIKPDKWYTDSVLYCYSKGYMSGISATTFDYKATMDRQMFATILAKIDGADTSSYTEMSFSDVKPGQWYSNSIEWAYQNGYASGMGEGIYGRKEPVSREQLAVFFKTYSEKNGIDVSAKADLSAYTDLGRVHSWALEAVEWAVSVGLISGTGENTLSPRDSATRAQVSVIINNYVENIK